MGAGPSGAVNSARVPRLASQEEAPRGASHLHPDSKTADTPILPPVSHDTVPTRELRPIPTGARRSKPHHLLQVEGPGAPREIIPGDQPLVLGRAPDCDVRVESGHVSRQHVVVRRVMEDLECRDLDSRNGTWLNDLRIHSAILRDGDLVQVGDAVFIFRSGR